jgi:hypothetical protein
MESSSDMPSVHIDVVSDVVCPWCYIGKRRLEEAIALTPGVNVSINWRPYFLNPWIPHEGIDRQTYLETKFGSVERYAVIAERIASAAALEGLVYNPEKISRQSNTLDCHRLILWSRSVSDPGLVKQRLMELYFAEGADSRSRCKGPALRSAAPPQLSTLWHQTNPSQVHLYKERHRRGEEAERQKIERNFAKLRREQSGRGSPAAVSRQRATAVPTSRAQLRRVILGGYGIAQLIVSAL